MQRVACGYQPTSSKPQRKPGTGTQGIHSCVRQSAAAGYVHLRSWLHTLLISCATKLGRVFDSNEAVRLRGSAGSFCQPQSLSRARDLPQGASREGVALHGHAGCVPAAIFGKISLVFGCIGTDFCKQIRVLQHFPKSTRLSG